MSAELKQVGWLSLFEIEDNEESSVKSLSGVFHCTHLRSDAVLQDLRAVASIGLVSLLAFLEPLAVSKTGTNALVPHGVVRKIKSAVCFSLEECLLNEGLRNKREHAGKSAQRGALV